MLLAFDLDKTLVTEDFVLPDAIERAIRGSRERGHLVTVLTGRPLAAARPYLDQLGITGPYSVNHGGYVMGEGGRALRRRRIAAQHVDGLLDGYLTDGEVEFSCIVDDVLWVRDPDDDRWGWAHTRSRRVDRFRPGMALDADKLVFYSQERSGELDREVAARHPDMLRYLWGDGFLEVLPAHADKGSALALIADRAGVPRSEVVAFGDGLNDFTMVTWAGHGVAVGDAHPDLVAAAAEHIGSPEDGGVAAWLEAHVL